ncbi:amidohydrolase family protein [Actinomadura rayongensis]|uniref:Amidohydrolase family protein n=1 Tax=Actinomadura rayongensis TaxID=1429076 RepID=A0A6I4WB61_9ACTN|nr:amidohydrolase family protein [Actinomadura rayongensis]MXQ64294.1 amidohydrolase family protein [Actinomadura rayongensis]
MKPLVIDADSHFMEPLDFVRLMDPALGAEVTEKAPTATGHALIAEVFESVPVDERPPAEEFIPDKLKQVFDRFEGRAGAEDTEVFDDPSVQVMFDPPGGKGGAERIEILDRHGIDVQIVNPNLAMAAVRAALRAETGLGLRVAEAYNTWAGSAVDGYTDRLLFTTVVPLDDVDWAVGELRRTRELGSRTWAMPLNPTGGRGLGDSHYDRLWAASLDLDMIPLLHVGFGWPRIDLDWLRIDGQISSQMMMRMGSGLMRTLPQTVLSHLVYRGVFDRFPDLKVCVQEFNLDWIDLWLDTLPNLFFPWEHKAAPEEILANNLRFTPLRDQDVASVIDRHGPDLVCYASDYPHLEGIASDWDYFDRHLAGYDAATRDRFNGGNMAALLGL